MRKLTVPSLFFHDHWGRDLVRTSAALNFGRFVATVELTDDEIEELGSDAHHYGCGGMDWGTENEWTRRLTLSARRTCAQMRKLTGKQYDHKDAQ